MTKLKQIGEALLKLIGIESFAAIALQTGYRNEAGERTQVGIHMALNFLLDENNNEAFKTYLRARRDEWAAEDAKNAKQSCCD